MNAKRRATYEDLMQVPDNLVAEIIDGELVIVAAAYGGDDRVRAEPFDAVELAMARWWLESASMG